MNELMLEARAGAPPLEQLQVAQVMHPGLITCALETPLRKVAQLMATYHIHAIVAFGGDEDAAELWGVVSDLDLTRAAVAGDFQERTAGGIAVTPVVTVSKDESVASAIRLMVEHETTHLIVVERDSERPIGVLSTFDVARMLAGMPKRSERPMNVVARTLTAARVAYDLLPHHKTQTAREEAAALGIRPDEVAKTIVVRADDGYVRAVLPASERLDVHKLAVRLESGGRLATEPELVWAYPQFELGAVPPVGGPAGDRVFVDVRLADRERLVFDAGVHDESIRMRTKDMLRIAHAEVGDICED